MATKNVNNVNGNVNVFDTVNNKVKTQTIDGATYLVGKEKSDGIHLIKDDGKGLNGCYENVGGSGILVERSVRAAAAPAPKVKAADVSGMSADDKLAALAAKGKADGFVKMSNANGEGSIWKMNGGAPVPVEDKEIEQLLGMILDQDYIHNMRIDRSWILPQMKWMLFDPKTGRMDTQRYREEVKKKEINDAWDLLVHNLGVMVKIEKKDPKAFLLFKCNWNRDLAIEMAHNDFANAKAYVKSLPTHKCSKFYPGGLEYVKICAMYGKGHYGKMYFTDNAERSIDWAIQEGYYKKEAMKTRTEQQFLSDLWKEFEKRIGAIYYARTTKQLYDAVKEYADNRIKYPMHRTEKKMMSVMKCNGKRELIKVDKVVFEAKFPEDYISAYKADGAYYTMRTMLRYFGDKLGISKTERDVWMRIIDSNMKAYAGEGYKMFGFMVNEFLPAIRFTKASDFDRLKK